MTEFDEAEIARIMAVLARDRPLFHSESDFQFALAQVLQDRFTDADIRLEIPLVREENSALDILVRRRGHAHAIELKYLKPRLQTTIRGEEFDLAVSGAQLLARHAVLRDVERIERFVARAPDRSGSVIVLCGAPIYWSPSRQADNNDVQFQIHDGRTVGGMLDWTARTAVSMRQKCPPVVLRETYVLRWQDWQAGPDVPKFRWLHIPVRRPVGT